MASESDRLLIQQIRQGDTRAWQQLIARYEGRLIAFAERRLRDRAASEDVVQETFIGFLNSLPNFDDRRELQTYLFTIAAHKITDQLRRVGRRPQMIVLDEDSSGASSSPFRDPMPAASSLARSQERERLESEAIQRCLGEIIRGWQQSGDYLRIKVMEMLFVKGWANRDVAAHLGVPDQQVANYRFAALRKLKELVAETGLPTDVFPELADVPDTDAE